MELATVAEVVNCIEETKPGDIFLVDGQPWFRRFFRSYLPGATNGSWRVVAHASEGEDRWSHLVREGIPVFWAIERDADGNERRRFRAECYDGQLYVESL